MTQLVTTAADKRNQVARPLHILVSLIRKDWDAATEAAEQAAKPYYRAIGEKLAEAKSDMTWADFNSWVERNFEFGKTQAQRYIQASNTTFTLTRARGDTSLSEAIRQSGGSPRGAERGGASWQEPVRKVLGRIDLDTLRDSELKRAEEREAVRKLALQFIDIAYKALATKLHPDKGGSRDAMSRLNYVRDWFKARLP